MCLRCRWHHFTLGCIQPVFENMSFENCLSLKLLFLLVIKSCAELLLQLLFLLSKLLSPSHVSKYPFFSCPFLPCIFANSSLLIALTLTCLLLNMMIGLSAAWQIWVIWVHVFNARGSFWCIYRCLGKPVRVGEMYSASSQTSGVTLQPAADCSFLFSEQLHCQCAAQALPSLSQKDVSILQLSCCLQVSQWLC